MDIILKSSHMLLVEGIFKILSFYQLHWAEQMKHSNSNQGVERSLFFCLVNSFSITSFFFCIFCMFDNPITLLSKGIELNWIPRYDVELLFSDKNKHVDSYQLLKVVCVLGYIWSFCVVFMKKCSVWNWSWLKADLHVTSLDNVIPYMFSTYSFLERV